MTKTFLKLAIAGSAAFAMMGPINAAPIGPPERANYKLSERHEFRDAQTGEYRPHGTQPTEKERVGQKILSGAPDFKSAQPEFRQPGDF